jgi:heme A synthase
MSSPRDDTGSFATYAWVFLGYLLLVILFGAWVRISFSGAGCGAHWPTCQGEVIPPDPTVETMIEYGHRLSSGLLGFLGLGLVGWAWKRFSASHRIFQASVVTLVFIVFESLIGAGLVLAELVERDDSAARAIVISLHLVNTMSLTGAAGLTAWWASGGRTPSWSARPRLRWWFVVIVVGLVATNMAGAITALGDTLFPTDPTLGEGLWDKVRSDLSSTQHFLVRLRVIHPVVATLTAALLGVVAVVVRTSDVSATARRMAAIVGGLTLGEVLIGVLNIYLGAPGWMQLVHLLLAQSLWIAVLIMLVETLRPPVDSSRP